MKIQGRPSTRKKGKTGGLRTNSCGRQQSCGEGCSEQLSDSGKRCTGGKHEKKLFHEVVKKTGGESAQETFKGRKKRGAISKILPPPEIKKKENGG